MVPATMLDTNREHLVWPGVPIGGQAVKPLYVKNASDTSDMSVTLSMQDTDCFLFHAYPKSVREMQLTLPPRGERYVDIVFSPTTAAACRGTVLIRPAAPSRVMRDTAVIRLSGYGGSSDVQIHVNGRDELSRPCLSVNTQGPGGTRIAAFSIANIGRRAAYIKLLVFADVQCAQTLAPHQASLHPSQFLLRTGEQRQVTAVVPGTVTSPQLPLDVGAVLVLSGDEILRLQLRQRPPGVPVSAPPHLRDIDFLAPYEGEQPDPASAVAFSSVPVPNMEELFFTTMKQTKLPLKYIPPKTAAQILARVSEHASTSPRTPGTYSVAPNSSQMQRPPELPAPLRQMAPLELTKRTASPPAGRRGSTSAPPAPPPPPPPAEPDWWPRPPGVQQVITENGEPKLRLSTNHLMFPLTPLGEPRSLPLQLSNLGSELIKWNIFGYSMPYLVTEPHALVKCGYDVFKMRPKDDVIQPGQTLSLQVTFSPPYPGKLTQLFQLLCKPAKETPGQPMTVYTLPVQVSGKGNILNEGEDESDLLTAPLHVSEDYLFFRHWSICHKVEITNKMPDELPVEYRVSGPFKVVAGPNETSLTDLTEGHMMAPSRRYVQMYVYFCPEQAGAFSGQLKLWLKGSQWRHLVRLEGTCQDVDALLTPHAAPPRTA